MKNFKTEILMTPIIKERGFKNDIEFSKVLICKATNNSQTRQMYVSAKVDGKSDRQIQEIIKNAKKQLRSQLC